MLEKCIDSAGDRHQRAVEDILAAQKNTIAELNEKREDIKKIIHGLYDESRLYFCCFSMFEKSSEINLQKVFNYLNR